MVVEINGTTGITEDGVNTVPPPEFIHYSGGLVDNGSSVTINGRVVVKDFGVFLQDGTESTPPNSKIIKRILSSTAYTTYRNKMFSYESANDGLMTTQTTQAVDLNRAVNRYAVSVVGRLEWAINQQDADFNPFKTYTVFALNHGAGAQYVGSVTYNGQSYTTTQLFSGTVILPYTISYAHITPGYNGWNNKVNVVEATFTKVSQNSGNSQELFVIPGKWAHISSTSTSGSYVYSDTKASDLFIVKSANPSSSYVNLTTSGPSNSIIMHRRNYPSGISTSVIYYNDPGRATISTTYTTSGSFPSTYNAPNNVSIFRLSEL